MWLSDRRAWRACVCVRRRSHECNILCCSCSEELCRHYCAGGRGFVRPRRDLCPAVGIRFWSCLPRCAWGPEGAGPRALRARPARSLCGCLWCIRVYGDSSFGTLMLRARPPARSVVTGVWRGGAAACLYVAPSLLCPLHSAVDRCGHRVQQCGQCDECARARSGIANTALALDVGHCRAQVDFPRSRLPRRLTAMIHLNYIICQSQRARTRRRWCMEQSLRRVLGGPSK
jgi:hypothetical protein